MATQKPISSISYNTEPFLREKLDGWVKAHIIQAYMYICHKGEEGDKDHIHFRIEPNKQLDPMELTDALREYEAGKDLPLGIRPWRPSKEEDWILYAVHDKPYLDLKYNGGEKGEKIPYDWHEIKYSQYYDMECAWIRAKSSMLHTTTNLTKRLVGGEKGLNLILQGENPYLISALMRTVSGTEYENAQDDISRMRFYISALEALLYREGYTVETDEKGNPVDLIKKQ